MNKIIPIFYACDDNFVKYTNVSITSLITNASKEYHYIIYVLNTNVSSEMKDVILKNQNENFKIEFIDVSQELKNLNAQLHVRDYYSKTTYYRLFIAKMFPEYEKAIYIDSDTCVLGDISVFFNHDLGSNLVGACHEQAMVQEDIFGTYVEQVVGISRHNFFNAGILLINSALWRKEDVLQQFIELLPVYKFVVTQDEDYLNIICHNRVLWIDSSWNMEVFGVFPCKEEDINIIHYIMVAKPWHFEDCRLKEYFWKYAEKTELYKEIQEELHNYTDAQRAADIASADRLGQIAIEETNREDSYFKMISKKKDVSRLNILNKINSYEAHGRFDEDVENDPPSRMINPGEVDYLQKKISSKINSKIAFYAARQFLNKIIENQSMIIKKIEGIENFRNLTSGAVITCNHFNAFDSFAIHVAYDESHHKKRKFYRVIREGNYTSFPGFYGYLMRNCNTLPLSSNMKTMGEFVRSTNQLLKDGHFVLFYPEQSMWWNYRKPKPLKPGAFKFSAKNDVPVLPCFITMEDSSLIGEDGFPVQKYTIHISKPIYPRKDLSIQENIEYLMEENYKLWKEIYEKTYNIPLQYIHNPNLSL